MLHSLGPFRLEPINFAAIEFSKEGARYSINLAQERRPRATRTRTRTRARARTRTRTLTRTLTREPEAEP